MTSRDDSKPTPHASCRLNRGGSEQTEFFELLSVTVDGDRVAYIAQPRGAAPTRFEMTALGERSVTFANPQHDFPKRIRCRLVDGDRLRATVDNGTDDGQRIEFAWRRVR